MDDLSKLILTYGWRAFMEIVYMTGLENISFVEMTDGFLKYQVLNHSDDLRAQLSALHS